MFRFRFGEGCSFIHAMQHVDSVIIFYFRGIFPIMMRVVLFMTRLVCLFKKRRKSIRTLSLLLKMWPNAVECSRCIALNLYILITTVLFMATAVQNEKNTQNPAGNSFFHQHKQRIWWRLCCLLMCNFRWLKSILQYLKRVWIIWM